MRTLLCAWILIPSVALAGNDSIVTVALGSHTIVSRHASALPDGAPGMSIGQGFSGRLRLLYLLGFELSYDMIGKREGSELNVPVPVYQWSGLLYLVPHSRFSLFLLGGFGATSFGDVMSSGGSTTSYHGGAGVEVGITRNWVFAADFRVNLPNYTQVVERGKEQAFKSGSTELPSIGTYYNLQTWQLNVGVRFYL